MLSNNEWCKLRYHCNVLLQIFELQLKRRQRIANYLRAVRSDENRRVPPLVSFVTRSMQSCRIMGSLDRKGMCRGGVGKVSHRHLTADTFYVLR